MAQVLRESVDISSMSEHCPFSDWIGGQIITNGTTTTRTAYEPSMAEAWYEEHERLLKIERRERNAVAAGQDRAKQWLSAMRKLSAHELNFKG
jgi:hypothetical protein